MNGAVCLSLPEDVKNRLEKLASRTGRSKTYYMIEAIREKLEDFEDLYLAEQWTIALREGRSPDIAVSAVCSADESWDNNGSIAWVTTASLPISKVRSSAFLLYESVTGERCIAISVGLNITKAHRQRSFPAMLSTLRPTRT